MDIILALISAVIGWIANHFYSRQGSRELYAANRDLKEVIEKLPIHLVEALAADQRQHLTVAELNELITNLTVDPSTGHLVRCRIAVPIG